MTPFITYDPATGQILSSGMIDALSLAHHQGSVLAVAEHRPDYDATHKVVDGQLVALTPEELAARVVPRGYAALRRAAYPPLTDLADAMYWNTAGDGSRLAAYLDAVAAVKLTYPKETP